MPEIRTYRDTPKRGETDSKWCGYIAEDNGHIIKPGTSGHETEIEAYRALRGDCTDEVHARMKALSDDDKMRFASNWRISHSLFNVACHLWPREQNTTLQCVDWHAIFKSRDLGKWSHGGSVYVQQFRS